MFTRIRSRIGSAHLIALIALVLALTGTSVALPGSGTVGLDDLKENSVNAAKVKNKTIGSGDVRPDAFNGNQIKENKLGTVRTAEEAQNVLWAVVSNPTGGNNATVARAGQGNTTVAETAGATVTFGRDVSGCAWTATRGSTGTGVEPAGFAQTAAATGNANGVEVRTRSDAGTPEDGNFHLVVVC